MQVDLRLMLAQPANSPRGILDPSWSRGRIGSVNAYFGGSMNCHSALDAGDILPRNCINTQHPHINVLDR